MQGVPFVRAARLLRRVGEAAGAEAFAQRHDARIFVGEFSAIAWAPGAERYLKDCIELFDEYGWDWCYHAFNEWRGWNVEYAGESREKLRRVGDTPRKRVLIEGLKGKKGK